MVYTASPALLIFCKRKPRARLGRMNCKVLKRGGGQNVGGKGSGAPGASRRSLHQKELALFLLCRDPLGTPLHDTLLSGSQLPPPAACPPASLVNSGIYRSAKNYSNRVLQTEGLFLDYIVSLFCFLFLKHTPTTI